jgi:hypothetical protein
VPGGVPAATYHMSGGGCIYTDQESAPVRCPTCPRAEPASGGTSATALYSTCASTGSPPTPSHIDQQCTWQCWSADMQMTTAHTPATQGRPCTQCCSRQSPAPCTPAHCYYVTTSKGATRVARLPQLQPQLHFASVYSTLCSDRRPSCTHSQHGSRAAAYAAHTNVTDGGLTRTARHDQQGCPSRR